jgi:hypothetical protein
MEEGSYAKDISIKKASNGGYILCYCLCTKRPYAGPYDNMDHQYKEESYSKKEGAKALSRMDELYGEGTE